MLKCLQVAPDMLEEMSHGAQPRRSLRTLSATEERRAQQLICGRLPDQLCLPFAPWTRGAIGELVGHESGIRLSIREVCEYVTWWRQTPQKAAKHA